MVEVGPGGRRVAAGLSEKMPEMFGMPDVPRSRLERGGCPPFRIQSSEGTDGPDVRCALSEWNDPELVAQRDRLLETLRGYGRVAVAYSGGVDSTVVAQAARIALGDAAIAVTAVSDSLAAGRAGGGRGAGPADRHPRTG